MVTNDRAILADGDRLFLNREQTFAGDIQGVDPHFDIVGLPSYNRRVRNHGRYRIGCDETCIQPFFRLFVGCERGKCKRPLRLRKPANRGRDSL